MEGKGRRGVIKKNEKEEKERNKYRKRIKGEKKRKMRGAGRGRKWRLMRKWIQSYCEAALGGPPHHSWIGMALGKA